MGYDNTLSNVQKGQELMSKRRTLPIKKYNNEACESMKRRLIICKDVMLSTTLLRNKNDYQAHNTSQIGERSFLS